MPCSCACEVVREHRCAVPLTMMCACMQDEAGGEMLLVGGLEAPAEEVQGIHAPDVPAHQVPALHLSHARGAPGNVL